MAKCDKCEMFSDSETFWDIHQTLSDLSIWCIAYTRNKGHS
jgi:hypothetical protein